MYLTVSRITNISYHISLIDHALEVSMTNKPDCEEPSGENNERKTGEGEPGNLGLNDKGTCCRITCALITF